MEAAETIWDLYGHDITPACLPVLVSFLESKNENVRRAAANGLAAAMHEFPKSVPVLLDR